MGNKHIQILHDALLMPFDGSMEKFTSGVFLDGRCVASSLIPERSSPAIPAVHEKTLNGTYIFGGYLFPHYGHFLLESLSRVYAIKTCNTYPLLFLSPNSSTVFFQRSILKFLSLSNEIIFVKERAVVKRLVYSEPGCVIPGYMSDDQINSLIAFKVENELQEKIWLSRSALVNCGGVDNETVIEDVLEKFGWKIVHPENMNIYDQVRMICSARIVAGFDGSAFFNVLFGDKTLGKFIVFGRRNFIDQTILNILSTKNVDYQGVVPKLEYVGGHGAQARFVAPDPYAVIETVLQVAG